MPELSAQSNQRKETNQTRFTCVGNLILIYPGDVSSETASLETSKMHLNGIISTPGAKHMTMDTRKKYLNTPLDRYKYIRMKLSDSPQQIIDQNNLNDIIAPDGYIYMEIC